LVLDMLQHVVQTLHLSEAFEQIYVVSADLRVLQLVQGWGARPLRETQQGHNPALQEAAHTILERSSWQDTTWTACHAQTRWTSKRAEDMQSMGLLTISADLPLLAREDIALLIEGAEKAQVVLASSSDGTGTNALLTRPPLALPYLFGPNSLPAYIQAAQQAEISYTLVQNAHLALDIDIFADLQQLERFGSDWFSMARFAI
jgi:2-phospho-L-lactate/phosphoenolpyruvate guanylyltransferase